MIIFNRYPQFALEHIISEYLYGTTGQISVIPLTLRKAFVIHLAVHGYVSGERTQAIIGIARGVIVFPSLPFVSVRRDHVARLP
jgi:hypothetical protein